MADGLLEELERLAERNEALKMTSRRRLGILGAAMGQETSTELRQSEIADLRERVLATCEGLGGLRGKQLRQRRHALDLLTVEVSGLHSELEARETR